MIFPQFLIALGKLSDSSICLEKGNVQEKPSRCSNLLLKVPEDWYWGSAAPGEIYLVLPSWKAGAGGKDYRSRMLDLLAF